MHLQHLRTLPPGPSSLQPEAHGRPTPHDDPAPAQQLPAEGGDAGGAADYELRLDGANGSEAAHEADAPLRTGEAATMQMLPLESPRGSGRAEERWGLHDVLTHTTFWRAQPPSPTNL